eukprot:CAMPEP_0194031860 /NCGR_PEP_ID=MMETSP0009_2-20130614/4935_1 /TAXON_ID=210454 /ORGANISM="Grammatophora oceanica, Strain CCMP 410" /LENGTH=30 /DNA_ID= /DNA_START= /DNA_END= /DNA_ORIENTATION=
MKQRQQQQRQEFSESRKSNFDELVLQSASE